MSGFNVGDAVRLRNARHFYGPGLPPVCLDAGAVVTVVKVARHLAEGGTVYVVEEPGGRRQNAPDYDLEGVTE